MIPAPKATTAPPPGAGSNDEASSKTLTSEPKNQVSSQRAFYANAIPAEVEFPIVLSLLEYQ